MAAKNLVENSFAKRQKGERISLLVLTQCKADEAYHVDLGQEKFLSASCFS